MYRLTLNRSAASTPALSSLRIDEFTSWRTQVEVQCITADSASEKGAQLPA